MPPKNILPKNIKVLTVENFQSSNAVQEPPQMASAPVESAEPVEARLARIVDLARRCSNPAPRGKRLFPLL